MIKLLVEDYCHECRGFEADVKRTTALCSDGTRYNETTIKCANHKRCEDMKRYLEKQLKEKGNG